MKGGTEALTTSSVVTPNSFLLSYTPCDLSTSAAMGTVELTGLLIMLIRACRACDQCLLLCLPSALQQPLLGSKRVKSSFVQGEGTKPQAAACSNSGTQRLHRLADCSVHGLQAVSSGDQRTLAGCSAHIGAVLAAGGDEGLDDAGIDLHDRESWGSARCCCTALPKEAAHSLRQACCTCTRPAAATCGPFLKGSPGKGEGTQAGLLLDGGSPP